MNAGIIFLLKIPQRKAGKMRDALKKVLQIVTQMDPYSFANLRGSDEYPDVAGTVWFYPFWDGTLAVAEIAGLPTEDGECTSQVFGFHIHEGSCCSGNTADPFADTGSHYKPGHCMHPQHAGDLPPLFGNDGYALNMCYTNRFLPDEVDGKTVIIHRMPDDFHTQPSGNSGTRIACGEIRMI